MRPLPADQGIRIGEVERGSRARPAAPVEQISVALEAVCLQKLDMSSCPHTLRAKPRPADRKSGMPSATTRSAAFRIALHAESRQASITMHAGHHNKTATLPLVDPSL
jgi:hypothetical protein